MSNGFFQIPKPQNEKVLDYAPVSRERVTLEAQLKEFKQIQEEIPLIIGGERIKTSDKGYVSPPHDHQHRLASFYKAGAKEVEQAVAKALAAKEKWAKTSWQERAAIFLKAAELLTGPYRYQINAKTMLGQSKSVHQAEIEASCELGDFWRFNPYFMQQIYQDQPSSTSKNWNRVEYRPLEGFVLAITPFNFTAIGGNLPTAPALMGNVVLWKPASTQVYSAYTVMQILEEAGLPPGVINFLPGSGKEVAGAAMRSPYLAGVHFTGSTGVFQSIWQTVGNNIKNYRVYPRLVGETGGKDFIVAHCSAEEKSLITALIRGAFEYQGQKCSAASRAYLPRSLWAKIKEPLLNLVDQIKMGPPEDMSNFCNAVIDKKAFDEIVSYINWAVDDSETTVLAGGEYDDIKGYFIRPTVLLTENPRSKTMVEEIFGPILTIYVYPDDEYQAILKLCDETSPYGLTGSIFARDRYSIALAEEILTQAAGNFYINDKPTGAIVDQQPFGGARGSGTNDKAGSYLNLLRWVSPRAIKENFVPATNYQYPYMD